jgi:hypothetical protein
MGRRIYTYKGEAFKALSSINDFKAISDALVHSWVCLKYYQIKTYLFATLNDIKWADSCVSDTACEYTTSHAFGIVSQVVIISAHSCFFF